MNTTLYNITPIPNVLLNLSLSETWTPLGKVHLIRIPPYQLFLNNIQAVTRCFSNLVKNDEDTLALCAITFLGLSAIYFLSFYLCKFLHDGNETQLIRFLEKENNKLVTWGRNLRKELMVYRNHETAQKNYSVAKDQRKVAKLTKELYSQHLVITQLRRERNDIRQILDESVEDKYNDDEWTLTQLKERAKGVGIVLLSKYNWDGRKALASAICDREKLLAIRELICEN